MDRNPEVARFSVSAQTGPGAHTVPFTMDTVSLSPGVKRPSNGVNHSPPYSAEVTEEVELHFYYPSVLSWQARGRTLPSLSLSKKGYPSSVIRMSLRTVLEFPWLQPC